MLRELQQYMPEDDNGFANLIAGALYVHNSSIDRHVASLTTIYEYQRMTEASMLIRVDQLDNTTYRIVVSLD